MSLKECTSCGVSKVSDRINFSIDNRKYKGLTNVCRDCTNVRRRIYQEKVIKHRDSATYKSYLGHIRRKYDPTEEALRHLQDEQRGQCAICGGSLVYPDGSFWKMHIDHCHSTGVVRGLLCKNCNNMLGMALDSEDILIKGLLYLRRSKEKIARILDEYKEELEECLPGELPERGGLLKCPECGGSCIPEGGCWLCPECAWSKCS